MKAIGNGTINAAIFASLGCLFAIVFQSMAYWGPGMRWFWVGVILAYSSMFLSVLFAVMNRTMAKLNDLDIFIRVLSVIVVIFSGLWTTFVVAMWLG